MHIFPKGLQLSGQELSSHKTLDILIVGKWRNNWGNQTFVSACDLPSAKVLALLKRLISVYLYRNKKVINIPWKDMTRNVVWPFSAVEIWPLWTGTDAGICGLNLPVPLGPRC